MDNNFLKASRVFDMLLKLAAEQPTNSGATATSQSNVDAPVQTYFTMLDSPDDFFDFAAE